MDKSGRPGSSLDRIGVRHRPAIASGPLLMILLFARCLLVCPGTTRQHPALAGIRSRREVHEPAACGILRHRLAESNTCCSGLLTAGSGFKSLAAQPSQEILWRVAAGWGPQPT